MCYSNLINRLESVLVEELGLKSKEFSSNKAELEQRYASIKTYLLTERQKTFLTRILIKNTDRVTWYQSLAYVVLDKQLEALIDEEEAYLVDRCISLFQFSLIRREFFTLQTKFLNKHTLQPINQI